MSEESETIKVKMPKYGSPEFKTMQEFTHGEVLPVLKAAEKLAGDPTMEEEISGMLGSYGEPPLKLEPKKNKSCSLEDIYNKARYVTSAKMIRDKLLDQEKEMENKLKTRKKELKEAAMEELFTEYEKGCVESKEGVDVSCCLVKEGKVQKEISRKYSGWRCYCDWLRETKKLNCMQEDTIKATEWLPEEKKKYWGDQAKKAFEQHKKCPL